MRKILVNSVQCSRCGDVIVSLHRHDLKWCKCGSVAVDGGTEYLRRLTSDPDAKFVERSEYTDGADDKQIEHLPNEKDRN